jgi:hypothetical protein
MKNENTYFAELEAIARDYETRHEAHKRLKQQIIDTKGWDSEELKAWYEEEENDFRYPISAGACKAFRAWRYSETDEVIMEDFTWEGQETHDFIDTLRKAGIQSLVVTNQSTGLMRNLHDFAAEGYTMQGLCTIIRKENRWGEETEEQIMGIRFSLN